VDALKAMIQNYNGEYLYSALGYKSPKILRRSTGIAILLSQLALTMPDGTELKILKEFFEANQHRFVFIFLPVYSTELNPIEKVRWITRRKVTHNQYFPSIEDFRMALES